MILNLLILIFMFGLILISIGVINWGEYRGKWSDFLYLHNEVFLRVGASIAICVGTIILSLLVEIVGIHFDKKAKLALLREEYNAITYKINSDSFGLSNKEVVDEVQEWNMALIHYQTMRKNTLVGVLYPDVYGELNTIEYENAEALEEKLDGKR